jgi:hypothetical protein
LLKKLGKKLVFGKIQVFVQLFYGFSWAKNCTENLAAA